MTNEQNIALVVKYREAEAAGDVGAVRRIAETIVRSNEGLTRKLAMRYARPQTEEDKEDAMQAGRMGLLRSLKDFDPKLGSFSTHANSHIRDYVQRWSGKTVAVARPRSASMPASIARAAAKFRMMKGEEPTAADLGVTEAQLTEWSSGTHFVEIDDSDDEKPRLELTYDAEEGEHAVKMMQLEAAWKAALDTLSPRNREIAECVLMQGETTVIVAQRHGLTHARVVQVCKRVEIRLKRAIDPTYEPLVDHDKETKVRALHAMRALRAKRAAEGAAA